MTNKEHNEWYILKRIFSVRSAREDLISLYDRRKSLKFQQTWWIANINVREKKLKAAGIENWQLVNDSQRNNYIKGYKNVEWLLSEVQSLIKERERFLELNEMKEIQEEFNPKAPVEFDMIKPEFGNQLSLEI